MFYEVLKNTHNLLRWAVLLAGLWALVRVWLGLINKTEWTKPDRIAGLIFTSTLNIQLLIGLTLYFISPNLPPFSEYAAAMKNAGLRFFIVEHPFAMILAVIIAQVGFSISKRSTKGSRHQFLVATITYTIAALLIVASIPWPFIEKYGRPLFPHFGG